MPQPQDWLRAWRAAEEAERLDIHRRRRNRKSGAILAQLIPAAEPPRYLQQDVGHPAGPLCRPLDRRVLADATQEGMSREGGEGRRGPGAELPGQVPLEAGDRDPVDRPDLQVPVPQPPPVPRPHQCRKPVDGHPCRNCKHSEEASGEEQGGIIQGVIVRPSGATAGAESGASDTKAKDTAGTEEGPPAATTWLVATATGSSVSEMRTQDGHEEKREERRVVLGMPEVPGLPGNPAGTRHGRAKQQRGGAALIVTLLLDAAAALDGERATALTSLSRHGGFAPELVRLLAPRDLMVKACDPRSEPAVRRRAREALTAMEERSDAVMAGLAGDYSETCVECLRVFDDVQLGASTPGPNEGSRKTLARIAFEEVAQDSS